MKNLRTCPNISIKDAGRSRKNDIRGMVEKMGLFNPGNEHASSLFVYERL
jgi:hypothetical protein